MEMPTNRIENANCYDNFQHVCYFYVCNQWEDGNEPRVFYMQAIQKYGCFSFPLFSQIERLRCVWFSTEACWRCQDTFGLEIITFGAYDYADFGHVVDTSFSKLST